MRTQSIEVSKHTIINIVVITSNPEMSYVPTYIKCLLLLYRTERIKIEN